ncbi:reductase AKOR2 [Sistotremastrum niveocremeum HHB9708]|uniref:Reductase AKOR2 n=2 Tax=Sistotremastraceae TaxID=3402574 RepID=A0A164QJX1_9AGAM|nr:reductase AKOR2 [Sistotremastrum niveocremeum HHB9708]KZT38770.1 Aldo/keto reductase [Sistotremastrum suecicum HHB10207 ss-3]
MPYRPYPTIKLNTGAVMPAIGLGTWSGTTKEEQESALPWYKTALKVGYRLFDTAHGYGTEPVVGKAIREFGIAREEVWVTTKLPMQHHDRVEFSLNESLERLGLDYVDLYLIHFPQGHPYHADDEPDQKLPDGRHVTLEHPDINEVWAQMEEVYKSGKAKNIGVSNYSVKTLTQLLKTAKVIPAVNQVEMHPHLNQDELKAFCDSKGIVLTAYSPSGYAPVREDPTVIKIADKYSVSPAQISLAWHIQRGTSAVPKSTSEERQTGNLFRLPILDEEDMKALGGLNKGIHLCDYRCPPGDVFGWSYEQMGW